MDTAKIKRRWVKGFTHRMAAGSDGVLYRYRRMTGELVPVPNDGNPVILTNCNGVQGKYTYAYLVARAFLDEPQVPISSTKRRPQVGFMDGDPTNTKPANLYWKATAKAQEIVERQYWRNKLAATMERGTYRQLDQFPAYYVKDDGTLHRKQKNGDLRRVMGTLSTSGRCLYVTLYDNILRRKTTARLQDIVACLFHGRRPGLRYRGISIDGDYSNTHPDNIAWEFSLTAGSRDPLHFSSTKATERHAAIQEEARGAAYKGMDSLYIQQARHLKNNLHIWAHPDGKALQLDIHTGAIYDLPPMHEGKIKFNGGYFDPSGKRTYTTHGINIFDFLADAFPDLLDRVRIPGQSCYPKDGNWQNTWLGNIAYSSTVDSRYGIKWYFQMDETRAPVKAYQETPTLPHSTAPGQLDQPTCIEDIEDRQRTTPPTPEPLDDDLENWL